MSLTSLVKYILTLSLFYSCIGKSAIDKFEVGQCFKESHSNYASYAEQAGRIYRVDGIENESLKVSLWYSKYWLYQGPKSANYFDNRSNLLYEETTCPGSRKNASITDKIKGIELNKK